MDTKTKQKKGNITEKKFVFDATNIEEIIQKQAAGYSLPRYMNPWFKNQVSVRRSNCVYGWSPQELDEYARCAVDIHYFANTYCKIKSEDGRVKQMKLRKYQYKVLDTYTKNRFTINMSSRQSGKTITAAITMLHYAIFNNDKGVMIIANKADTTIEIIDKIKNIYKLLPFFLKPGVINWNNKNIIFDNGTKIKSSARTKEPAIGFTIDFLYMDEFAHIPNNIVRHYYRAAIPTVSSIDGSKIIITSTPNGANLFKELVVSSELPEGNPDKGMYKVIKVYWHEVPDGTFDDGTQGTRLDPKIYIQPKEMKEYGVTTSDIIKTLGDAGFKVARNVETSDNGNKEVIRVLHQKDVSDLEMIRQFKIRDIGLAKVSTITNWKEQEVKLIQGEENFNQEYNLQFIAGSKRVISAKKAQELEARSTKYVQMDIELLKKRLKFLTDGLRWAPDFIEADRKKHYWVTSIDTAEGLGLDYSVLNMFRLAPRNKEWLASHKIKNLFDAFYLKQTGIWSANVMDPKEVAELYYLLHFEYFDPEKCKTVLELNGPGNTFLKELPNVFEMNNEFGNYIFVRYQHNQNDKFKKPGLKLGNNKKSIVKTYIDSIESDKIYVDEDSTLGQMDNFVKVETRSGSVTYRADFGHDDEAMTVVNVSTIFGMQEWKNMCETFYKELPKDHQDAIDKALDLEYNPEAISYKGVSSALGKAKNGGFGQKGRFNKR